MTEKSTGAISSVADVLKKADPKRRSKGVSSQSIAIGEVVANIPVWSDIEGHIFKTLEDKYFNAETYKDL